MMTFQILYIAHTDVTILFFK